MAEKDKKKEYLSIPYNCGCRAELSKTEFGIKFCEKHWKELREEEIKVKEEEDDKSYM